MSLAGPNIATQPREHPGADLVAVGFMHQPQWLYCVLKQFEHFLTGDALGPGRWFEGNYVGSAQQSSLTICVSSFWSHSRIVFVRNNHRTFSVANAGVRATESLWRLSPWRLAILIGGLLVMYSDSLQVQNVTVVGDCMLLHIVFVSFSWWNGNSHSSHACTVASCPTHKTTHPYSLYSNVPTNAHIVR